MADVRGRVEKEKKLARQVGLRLGQQRNQIMSRLDATKPAYDQIPTEWWESSAGELRDVFGPFVEDTFKDQARTMLDGLPFDVDWTLINRRAADFAETYTFDLVRGITDTSQQALQDAIGSYFEDDWTMGDLGDALESDFGPVRAEAIAVTEVTRAASEGEQAIATELEGQGIELVPVWQTNDDELVCEICGPRHGQVIDDEMYPPAHVRCRCWTNHRLPSRRRNG